MADYGLIDAADSQLLVIDIQTRLVPALLDGEKLIRRASRLIQAARLLDVSLIVSEQYPAGLGQSVSAIANLAAPQEIAEKQSFSCFGDKGLVARLDGNGRPRLILAGCETHVCVLQTALEALERGYRPVLAVDAVSSRFEEDRRLALRRADKAGITLATTEMILFEWMRTSAHPAFRAISSLVKD
jgi:nicotinamidase-related amidase